MTTTSAGSAVPCPALPDELWRCIIMDMCEMHGLYAAKHLRAYARVSHVFWWHARNHPDNNLPGHAGWQTWSP